MSKDTRTATDILIEIERKQDLILGYVKNLDNNFKIVLARLNSNAMQPVVQAPVALPQPEPRSALVKMEEVKKVKFEDLPKTNKFQEMAKEVGIDVEEEELLEDPLPTGQRRGDRAQKTESGTRVAVSQQIEYSGKPVILATVNVIDGTGKSIKMTRTNTSGRWTAALEPGMYTISVLKISADSSKPKIDTSYLVEIPQGKKIDLPIKDTAE